MEIMMAWPMVRRLLDGTKTQTRRTGARWLNVLGAKPDTMVTAIEFKVVRV